MGKNTQNIKYKDINCLISAEYNPRQLKKEQYQNIKESLQRFGFVDPVIINKNKDRKNIIIGGHQRIKVAKDLDYKEIPCIELDLTLEREKELNIRLNKNVGEWDYDILANLFDVNELVDWGFNDKDFWFLETDDLSNNEDYSDNTVDEKLKRFLGAKVKQITIPYAAGEFDDVVKRLDGLMVKLEVENYSDLLIKVLDNENC